MAAGTVSLPRTGGRVTLQKVGAALEMERVRLDGSEQPIGSRKRENGWDAGAKRGQICQKLGKPGNLVAAVPGWLPARWSGAGDDVIWDLGAWKDCQWIVPILGVWVKGHTVGLEGRFCWVGGEAGHDHDSKPGLTGRCWSRTLGPGPKAS